MNIPIGTASTGAAFRLPLDLVTQTVAILAKKGAGKSYTASVMVEGLLEAGQVPVVLDPTGAWWGLKSSADGKSPGYPMVVFGGEHSDLPLEEHAGEATARAIVEQRFPAIIDLSLFRKSQVKRFVTPFLETLYRLNRLPLMLVVDEADDICPQKPFGDEAQMVGALEDVVKRGRKKGIGCILITQRPADLAKQVLTQCEMLVAMRVSHPLDIKAVMEWVNVHADTTQAKLMVDSLPGLPVGTAWFWSPGWGDIFTRVQVSRRGTFDSGATPKAGEVVITPKRMAQADLTKIGSEIMASVERAKADDPKALKTRIAQLEGEAKTAKPPTIEIKEVPMFSERDGAQIQEASAILSEVSERLRQAANIFAILKEEAAQRNARFVAIRKSQENLPPYKFAPIKRPDKLREQADTAGVILSKAERAILTCLAQLGPCMKNRVAAVSGYSRGGGSFNNALGSLRTADFITRGEPIEITKSGETALGSWNPLPTGTELIECWLRRLSKAEAAILRFVCERSPNSCTKAEIAEATGYEAGGGSFNNALGALRTLELITRGSEIKASDNLA